MIDSGNRILSDGIWSYTYDDTGAVTGKSKSGEAWAYTYDLNGQMTSASKSVTVGGTVTDSVSYTYDAWGNRVSRTQSGTTSSTERYVVDGWDTAKPGAVGTENFDVTVDLNGSNAVTARRMFGAGFDNAVARRDSSGAVSWYGADALGSIRQVFDNSGNVTGSRTYDGFGNVTASSGSGLDRYGYTGTVTDALTGLVGDNARSYDPTTGRWMSQDPIGFNAGDVNLYRYVGNSATTGRDPSGMLDLLPPWFKSNGAAQRSLVAGFYGAALGFGASASSRALLMKPAPTLTERIARQRYKESWSDFKAQAWSHAQNKIKNWAASTADPLRPYSNLGNEAIASVVNGFIEIPKFIALNEANSHDVAATRLEEQNGTCTGPSSADRQYSYRMGLFIGNTVTRMYVGPEPNLQNPIGLQIGVLGYQAEKAAPKNYKRGVEAAPGLMETILLTIDIVTLGVPAFKLLRGISLAEKLVPRALRLGGEAALDLNRLPVSRLLNAADKERRLVRGGIETGEKWINSKYLGRQVEACGQSGSQSVAPATPRPVPGAGGVRPQRGAELGRGADGVVYEIPGESGWVLKEYHHAGLQARNQHANMEAARRIRPNNVLEAQPPADPRQGWIARERYYPSDTPPDADQLREVLRDFRGINDAAGNLRWGSTEGNRTPRWLLIE